MKDIYITGDLRTRVQQHLALMAAALESDLSASDWRPHGLAARIRERAESLASWVEGLDKPVDPVPVADELYSMFTHKGRVHMQFPTTWVSDAVLPKYAQARGPHGTEAFVFFPKVGHAFRIYEVSSLSAGIGQPTAVIEPIHPALFEWSAIAPAIFESLDTVRIYGGSNSPIKLHEV